ncbi:uncharacterized protein LOC125902267 isoform X1 [Epinephelus fuscoguttatus]|uniref:uncharacterized protein LOC125902267 isoform X1 n=1 Tax=Epinephelus fuscoguttatus TaxID=293821 RepID=UPI0020D12B9C|nr:uncharacterized protein LOC125902267 isoform X1 [Epinephelus fuscoguttatus]XP_049454444.1 uncharacterized protein LOC125902267 isoform X1 [Epinephelus fuscoguttatus]XP_049454445.1 uncharacterized protein LOC125902267 isoform X1 [Epinephelus fuscoguttatus]XP_049454446.1 uncharacterized protein LOC125902267 isoform X1 [Epinephelus fuscoguttatus]XP_049454447.1 uncharacterized protein LOC125902267 isoform X1 [Epinephelus fuscoguttatus]XP_049454448.1 uncharacterized protein LOC125902267 isoform 
MGLIISKILAGEPQTEGESTSITENPENTEQLNDVVEEKSTPLQPQTETESTSVTENPENTEQLNDAVKEKSTPLQPQTETESTSVTENLENTEQLNDAVKEKSTPLKPQTKTESTSVTKKQKPIQHLADAVKEKSTPLKPQTKTQSTSVTENLENTEQLNDAVKEKSTPLQPQTETESTSVTENPENTEQLNDAVKEKSTPLKPQTKTQSTSVTKKQKPIQHLADAVKEKSTPLKPQTKTQSTSVTKKQKPIQHLADAVKEKSKLLKLQTGSLPVYKITLKKEQIKVAGCKRFSLGKEITKPNRTIMVLGATGAGKSTLINGMINYILGVKWEDSYRFKLVDEDQSTSQAHSQTSDVTVYNINHQEGFKIEHSLTIVDTPGFGDTRGIERDREITEQLRNLFSAKLGVSDIDAVCFVAQAALARLTPTQKYVFDSVLSIFGKDIAENIRVLVTFADGQKPPVLEAIKASGVPCPQTTEGQPLHFKFNNSALFADNKSSAADSMSEDDEDGSFDKMFWDMGTKSMKRFFAALNVMDTKSLTMTKEVLRERQQLENSVENLQTHVRVGLAKLEELKETTDKLKEHEAEISRNENFEFEVTVMMPVQKDISGSGNYITNCQQCHFTCHYPCAYSNDADKARCGAMGPDGKCRQCPGKCNWNVHFNQKYKWEYKEVTEKRTVTELKEKYLQANEAKAPVEALFGKLRAAYDNVHKQVVKFMEMSARCLNRLKEIALKPNPLSTSEYIDMLIEGEKSEAKPGWKQRVQSLMAMREKAQLMAKVGRGEKLLRPSDH